MELVNFKSTSHFIVIANKVFNEQKEKLQKLLPYADIQHIGSTSIPNSITKGDLDIIIRVTSNKYNDALEKLKSVYEINQPNNWTPTFASFKDDKNLEIPFGAQLVVINSKEDAFVKIRDILNKNIDLVNQYNQIKTKYEGKNMDEYRKEKGEFFQKLLKKYK